MQADTRQSDRPVRDWLDEHEVVKSAAYTAIGVLAVIGIVTTIGIIALAAGPDASFGPR